LILAIELIAGLADLSCRQDHTVAEQIFSSSADTLSGTVGSPRRLTPSIGALVAAAVTTLRKRATEPGMPRMSSEWLNGYDKWGGGRWTN
jgi:hypothetical protein